MATLHETLATLRAGFGPQRFEVLLKRCLEHLVARHRYEDAVAVLDLHVPGPPPPGLLGSILPLGAQGRHRRDFLARVRELRDPAAVAALLSQSAAEVHDLPRAEMLLAEVPKDHPMRRPALHRVFKAAQCQRDVPRAGRIGTQIAGLRTTDADLEVLQCTLRAAACAGRMDVARRTFGQFEALMDAIRASDDRFRKRWKAVARTASEMYDVGASEADLARAERMGLLTPDQILGAEAARTFMREHRGIIASARENLRALLTGRTPAFPEDELVRVHSATARLLVLGRPHYLNPMLCWLAVTDATIAEARASGGSVSLVPEWLGKAAAAHRRAPMVLSYHTVGRDPGVVHFKEADLPGYVSLDPGGYAGWSRLARRGVGDLPLDAYRADQVEAFFGAMRARVLGLRISKYAQPHAVAPVATLPDDYVLVALQVSTDSVQELARVPMLRMLDMVVRRFAETGTRVVVKRHPLCRDMGVALALDDLAARDAILVREDNIHDLIAGARAVVTVNSGVGSEALLHLKPVYLFGRADYAAVAHNVADEADFRERTDPIRLPVSEDVVKRFLFHYRRVALVDVTDSEKLRAAVRGRVIGKALERVTAGCRAPVTVAG